MLNRDDKSELTALSLAITFCPDLPAVEFNKRLAQRQAQSSPLVSPIRVTLYLLERLKLIFDSWTTCLKSVPNNINRLARF